MKFLFQFVVKCVVECLADDILCKTDRVGFEAIAHLHSQIDDDHDGSLNRAESAEVLIPSYCCSSCAVLSIQTFTIITSNVHLTNKLNLL